MGVSIGVGLRYGKQNPQQTQETVHFQTINVTRGQTGSNPGTSTSVCKSNIKDPAQWRQMTDGDDREGEAE